MADLRDALDSGQWFKLTAFVLAGYLIVAIVLGIWWSRTPEVFPVSEHVREVAAEMEREPVTGFATMATMIRLTETLLDKPGGYLSNDIFPPGLWLDNMPNWEYGVLVQLRDMSRALRRDLSRSQSQSAEDADLVIVEPQLHFSNNSWMLPSTEREYRRAIRAMQRYLDRLSHPEQPQAQFYARADNLNNWLADIETRLGSLSRRLGESVGKDAIHDALLILGDDPLAEAMAAERVKTPWTEIDDVFFEARGTAWALLHLFQAIEVDFRKVLQDKNAQASVRQIIFELEGALRPMRSPIVLNGSGFGVLANHSLTMGAYISRTNAAVRDLRQLLSQG
ncbi:MAG: DUF2333 family protein [Marinobacter sp.]|nr:DUF2333 family protein [Marinobacter sp.]